MTDNDFTELMRDAARTYRRPPEPPLGEMWAVVETSFEAGAGGAASAVRVLHAAPRRRSRYTGPWLRAAAVLLLGIAIGRGSASRGPDAVPAMRDEYALTVADGDGATERYLDHAAALLTALPAELREDAADDAFTMRAGDLLLQTRRLLDAPELADPTLHALLEDLELVLVQVVRLQADRDPMKMDLLEESLEQRDVLPRLRNAVAFHSTD